MDILQSQFCWIIKDDYSEHYGFNGNFPIVLDFVIRNLSWYNHWYNFLKVINCKIIIVIGTPMDLKVDFH